MPSPILYEINTRVWLSELSARAGHPVTLADIPESEIVGWKELGFTHIWLMGLWQVGPEARNIALGHWREKWQREIPSTAEDVQGSPFAIQEYSVDSRSGQIWFLVSTLAARTTRCRPVSSTPLRLPFPQPAFSVLLVATSFEVLALHK